MESHHRQPTMRHPSSGSGSGIYAGGSAGHHHQQQHSDDRHGSGDSNSGGDYDSRNHPEYVGTTAMPGGDGDSAAHPILPHRTAERSMESPSSHRFPNFILDTPLPQSSASSSVPSNWGHHQGRSASSFHSPPLISPLYGATFSRRDSNNSTAMSAVLSPAVSNASNASGSAGRDEGYSHRVSRQGDSPQFSTGSSISAASSRNNFDGSSSAVTLQPLSHQATSSMDSAQPQNYYGERQSSSELSSYASGNEQNQMASSPQSSQYVVARQNSGGANRQDRPAIEFPGYEMHGQGEEYSNLTVSPGWTGMLYDAHTGDTVSTATTSANSSVSAASLRNLIHPYEQPQTEPASSNVVAVRSSGTGSGKKKKGSGKKSSKKVIHEDSSSLMAYSRKHRGIFTPEQRQETSKTRAVGACLRCKSQRIRCRPSPDGPFAPCLTCQEVQSNSKKVLHDLACSRWRLGEMVVYRKGGLCLTSRWRKDEFKDINDWVDHNIYEIQVKLFYTSAEHRYDLCDIPVTLRVRRFFPQIGDVLSRKWTKYRLDQNGNQVKENRYINLPAFALANLQDTMETLRHYFFTNAIHALLHSTRNCMPVIREHYEAAAKHYWSLPEGDIEKVFLEKFFMLWFCIRFTTGSAYISGTDKLGCRPVNDPDYPLGDRISIPRMVTAQCDYIMVKKFLQPIGREVMLMFEKLFHIGNPDHWFTLYVCTFIFLHEASFSSQDRRRHAIDNWVLDARYTVSDFVSELQFGSCIILRHWHYYRTMTPMDEGWDIFCKIINPSPHPRPKFESAKGKGKKKVHITAEQFSLITKYWQQMLEADAFFEKYENRQMYEHSLFFVSQMYVKHWKGRKTYNVEDEQIRRLGLQPNV